MILKRTHALVCAITLSFTGLSLRSFASRQRGQREPRLHHHCYQDLPLTYVSPFGCRSNILYDDMKRYAFLLSSASVEI